MTDEIKTDQPSAIQDQGDIKAHGMIYLAALLCRTGEQIFSGEELQEVVRAQPNIEFLYDAEHHAYKAQVREEDAVRISPLLGGIHPALRDLRALITLLCVTVKRLQNDQPVVISVKDVQEMVNYTLLQTLKEDGTWALETKYMPPHEQPQPGKLN